MSGTTTSGGSTYYTYSTLETPPYGFYSSLMTSGQSRTSGSKLLMNGTVNLGDVFGEGLGLDFGIDLNDFVIFDGNASQGQTLDSESGTFTTPYSEEVELFVEYTLSSIAGQSYPNFISNEDSYQNVKSATLVISAKITANIVISGFPLSFVVLDTQNIISSMQYYADNIGVIFSDYSFQYQLDEIPIPGIELPLQQNYQYHVKEFLDDYSVE